MMYDTNELNSNGYCNNYKYNGYQWVKEVR